MGDSHEKSSASTCATSVVDTSAPIMIAIAAVSVRAPFFAKDVASRAVAVELCKKAVTAIPDAKAEKRLPVPLAIARRKFVPKARLNPCRTSLALQSRRQTAPAMFSSISVMAMTPS